MEPCQALGVGVVRACCRALQACGVVVGGSGEGMLWSPVKLCGALGVWSGEGKL